MIGLVLYSKLEQKVIQLLDSHVKLSYLEAPWLLYHNVTHFLLILGDIIGR